VLTLHFCHCCIGFAARLLSRHRPLIDRTYISSSKRASMAQDSIANDENRGAEEVEIEPDFSKKHPLNCRWTLWFDNPSGKQTMNKYGQTLRAVYTFDTVEDFWW
jgi:hypothetical protein